MEDALNPPRTLTEEEVAIETKAKNQETLSPSEERKWNALSIEREIRGYIQSVIDQFKNKVIHIKCLETHVNNFIATSQSKKSASTSSCSVELPPLEKPIIAQE